MRILVAHCRYRQRGGEDAVFDTESAQLADAGHSVHRFELSNDAVQVDSVWARLDAARQTIWADHAVTMLADRVRAFRPDVVHFHNVFPLLSPRAYFACRDLGVPVVQTLHNYRLLCAGALFLRDGKVCEDCLGGRFYRGVLHACYRGSRAASGAVVAGQYVHRLLGTYRRKVDRFVALTDFARGRFIAGGVPAARITVKPNSLSQDPGTGLGDGGYVLFVGRLSPEKGIDVLLDAWREVGPVPLRIAGDGPLRTRVEATARELGSHVDVLGAVPGAQVIELMQRASLLVVPSTWYEGFPMTIIESYSCATPVLAARIGSLAEVVVQGRTGMLFEAGVAAELAAVIRDVTARPGALAALRPCVRAHYEAHFTPAANVSALKGIYESVIGAGRH